MLNGFSPGTHPTSLCQRLLLAWWDHCSPCQLSGTWNWCCPQPRVRGTAENPTAGVKMQQRFGYQGFPLAFLLLPGGSARPAPASGHCRPSDGIQVSLGKGSSSGVVLAGRRGDHWHRDRFCGVPRPHVPHQGGAGRSPQHMRGQNTSNIA